MEEEEVEGDLFVYYSLLFLFLMKCCFFFSHFPVLLMLTVVSIAYLFLILHNLINTFTGFYSKIV